MAKTVKKPCSIPLCPFMRAKGSWLCTIHKKQFGASAGQRRGHKFGAIRTEVDNITFDSKAESQHYQELRLRLRANIIRQLRLQTKWPLHVNGVLIGHYVSDFDYLEGASPEVLVVSDVKGVRTPLYRWKRKHFEAEYGMKIQEVG